MTLSGLLHPLIHLGFGISFKQPAIIAEALAQAATHPDDVRPLILAPSAPKTANPPSLFTILHCVQQSETIRNSVKWADASNFSDGALTRSLKELNSIFSDYHIPATPVSIDKASAEMTSLSGYFTLTALRPNRAPKVDFFYLHCFNSSIFFRTFNALPEHSFSLEDKVRLLEAKAKVDIAVYTSLGSPALSVAELEKYTAERAATRKTPVAATNGAANGYTNGYTNGAINGGDDDDDAHGEGAWQPLFRAANALTSDDGHVAKVIRAAASAAQVCGPYEEGERWPLRGANWSNAAKMVLESVHVPNAVKIPLPPDSVRLLDSLKKWVMVTGFEEAWEGVPTRNEGLRVLAEAVV